MMAEIENQDDLALYKDELIQELIDYVNFLSLEINKSASLAFIHGQRCLPEIVKKGKKFRKRIELLKEKARGL